MLTLDLRNSCLTSFDFSKELLLSLFTIAGKIKILDSDESGRKMLNNTLSHIRASLFFNQPSTRTFISFANSCHLLGIKFSDIRDILSSSVKKGESFSDTIHTLSQYTDLIIMRNSDENAAKQASDITLKNNVKLINAGSGMDQHPTQALLDIYTIQDNFQNSGGIDDKTILIAGDLKRGRAPRSLIYILKNYNVNLILASPDELKPEADIIKFLNECENLNYTSAFNISESLKDADVIYMTRMQDEYDKDKESIKINYEPFKLKFADLAKIKKHAIIMHPLPRRDEIEVGIDNDSRAKYWEQEKNGMYVRAALIAYMFNAEAQILNY
ncbi:aspartate carbamoyltransferase [soil metagenome]